jgi:hypothetical protein
MQSFPILKEKQVAIMRADTLKGYVLDESFAVANDDKQLVYTIINSFDEALTIANQIIKEHTNVECVIYDKDQKVVSFLRPRGLDPGVMYR